jgi:hypothetical protein
MKTAKSTIVICSFVFALSLICSLKVDAQELEIGLRYSPEFTVLTNKNDANTGSALGWSLQYFAEDGTVGKSAIRLWV